MKKLSLYDLEILRCMIDYCATTITIRDAHREEDLKTFNEYLKENGKDVLDSWDIHSLYSRFMYSSNEGREDDADVTTKEQKVEEIIVSTKLIDTVNIDSIVNENMNKVSECMVDILKAINSDICKIGKNLEYIKETETKESRNILLKHALKKVNELKEFTDVSDI